MAKKEEIQKTEVVEEEPKDKSIISSEDVEEVVSGDEEALAEQMERIKLLTKDQQLEALQNEKLRQMELEKKKQQEQMLAQKQAMLEANERARRQQEAIILAQKKAQEDKMKQQQLIELQKQEAKLKMAEQQSKLKQTSVTQDPPAPLPNNKDANKKEASPKQNNNKSDGPTTFKRVVAVLIFILFMGLIYFMPQITSYINDIKDKNRQEEITSGTLECNLQKTDKNFDIEIEALFYFTNRELYKMSYKTIHTGDENDDKKQLKKLNEDCQLLKKETVDVDGVSIACSLNNGINTNKQTFDFEKLDVSKVTTAYTEAGGIYPAEFTKYENIDKIESQMTSNGYVCKKQ